MPSPLVKAPLTARRRRSSLCTELPRIKHETSNDFDLATACYTGLGVVGSTGEVIKKQVDAAWGRRGRSRHRTKTSSTTLPALADSRAPTCSPDPGRHGHKVRTRGVNVGAAARLVPPGPCEGSSTPELEGQRRSFRGADASGRECSMDSSGHWRHPNTDSPDSWGSGGERERPLWGRRIRSHMPALLGDEAVDLDDDDDGALRSEANGRRRSGRTGSFSPQSLGGGSTGGSCRGDLGSPRSLGSCVGSNGQPSGLPRSATSNHRSQTGGRSAGLFGGAADEIRSSQDTDMWVHGIWLFGDAVEGNSRSQRGAAGGGSADGGGERAIDDDGDASIAVVYTNNRAWKGGEQCCNASGEGSTGAVCATGNVSAIGVGALAGHMVDGGAIGCPLSGGSGYSGAGGVAAGDGGGCPWGGAAGYPGVRGGGESDPNNDGTINARGLLGCPGGADLHRGADGAGPCSGGSSIAGEFASHATEGDGADLHGGHRGAKLRFGDCGPGEPGSDVVDGDGSRPGSGCPVPPRRAVRASSGRRRSSVTAQERGTSSHRKVRSSSVCGKRGKRRRDDNEDEEEPSDEKIQGFMDDVFKEYATCHDNQRRPLMNCPDLRRYFRAMFGEENQAKAKADLSYDLFLERQVDMSFRFELSKAEAKRGLTLMTFQTLINEIMPKGVSRNAVAERFCDFAGDAKALKAFFEAP